MRFVFQMKKIKHHANHMQLAAPFIIHIFSCTVLTYYHTRSGADINLEMHTSYSLNYKRDLDLLDGCSAPIDSWVDLVIAVISVVYPLNLLSICPNPRLIR